MSQLPNLKQMLSELIALPSISSAAADWDHSNRGVIDRLAQWLQPLGFQVEIMPVSCHAGREKVNMIATLGKGPGGLVLSGHTDTVPYDAQRWQSDPFQLIERDDRWYGLGACDMKGFFPLVIEAVRSFTGDQAAPLQQPLIILATADEESSMDGAQALVAAGRPKARYAVIGEPTDLRPIRMHKGIMMERLAFRGQSGHSSDPALGRSALEGMHEALSALLSLRQEWQSKWHNAGFAVAVPTLNLGHIHGGDNPNRICAECELHFDLRPLPGMDIAELRAAMRNRLQPIAQTRGLSMDFEPLFAGVPAFETPSQSGLVQLCERLTGHQAAAVGFATEAPFLQRLGMDTLIMGPGSIDQAHQPDEFLALNQIQPCIDLLRQLIYQSCVLPQSGS